MGLHGERLAGDGGLVELEGLAPLHGAVGREDVARRDDEDVARRDDEDVAAIGSSPAPSWRS
jgi:hypothetical protein